MASAALSALILCSLTLLALGAKPLTHDTAPQDAIEQQAVPVSSSHNTPSVARRLLQHAAARTLLASTATSDRDLGDRSHFVTNSALESAYKSLEVAASTQSASTDDSMPFRRLLAKPGRFFREKALKEKSPTANDPTILRLEAAYRRFEAAAVTDSSNDISSIPFRRLLVNDHTSDRDLEDRTDAATNPALIAAVKRLEADSSGSADSIPFRRLLVSAHTSDRDLEDRSDAATNPALTAAVNKLEADSGEGADNLPFRRLLVSGHTSDSELEDRSAAVTNPLLLSAYKRFEADQAVDGGSNTEPFRKLLAAAAAAAAVPGAGADQAADQPATSH